MVPFAQAGEMNRVETLARSGVIAHRCLAPGQRGRVLAAVSKAIYLRDERGEVFWIAQTDVPMHRRCACVSRPLPQPAADSEYRVAGRTIRFGESLGFDLPDPLLWREPASPHTEDEVYYVVSGYRLSARCCSEDRSVMCLRKRDCRWIRRTRFS